MELAVSGYSGIFFHRLMYTKAVNSISTVFLTQECPLQRKLQTSVFQTCHLHVFLFIDKIWRAQQNSLLAITTRFGPFCCFCHSLLFIYQHFISFKVRFLILCCLISFHVDLGCHPYTYFTCGVSLRNSRCQKKPPVFACLSTFAQKNQ